MVPGLGIWKSKTDPALIEEAVPYTLANVVINQSVGIDDPSTILKISTDHIDTLLVQNGWERNTAFDDYITALENQDVWKAATIAVQNKLYHSTNTTIGDYQLVGLYHAIKGTGDTELDLCADPMPDLKEILRFRTIIGWTDLKGFREFSKRYKLGLHTEGHSYKEIKKMKDTIEGLVGIFQLEGGRLEKNVPDQCNFLKEYLLKSEPSSGFHYMPNLLAPGVLGKPVLYCDTWKAVIQIQPLNAPLTNGRIELFNGGIQRGFAAYVGKPQPHTNACNGYVSWPAWIMDSDMLEGLLRAMEKERKFSFHNDNFTMDFLHERLKTIDYPEQVAVLNTLHTLAQIPIQK